LPLQKATKSSQIAENTRVEPQSRFFGAEREAAEYERKRISGNFEQADGLDL
jgi:hypothetical protein